MLERAAAIAMLVACAPARSNGEVHEPVPPANAPIDAPHVDEQAEAAVVDTPPPDEAAAAGDIRPVDLPPAGDRVVRAREHFARGLKAFETGDHSRALQEFMAADQLVPKPQLRFNIARCRSAMGDLHGARMELQALLARGDADEAMRRHAAAELAAIDRKLGAPGPQ